MKDEELREILGRIEGRLTPEPAVFPRVWHDTPMDSRFTHGPLRAWLPTLDAAYQIRVDVTYEMDRVRFAIHDPAGNRIHEFTLRYLEEAPNVR